MDKFKIKLIPDWKVLFDICLNIVGMTVVVGLIMFMSSCSEDTFIGGYNKDLEEIHYQIFEIDSLIMTIQKDLDSLNTIDKLRIDTNGN